jgi:hypothetical protein
VLPGDEIFLRVTHLEANEKPKVYIGNALAQVTAVKVIRGDTSLVVVRTPGIVGEAEVRVQGQEGTHTLDQQVRVLRAHTIRYPKDQPYLLRNPHGAREIRPTGNQPVLVVAGVPADVQPAFTAAELEFELQARLTEVSHYWQTISQDNVSLQPTIYPDIVPLPNDYGDYIQEFRYPVARGTPVVYPVDLSGLTDTAISMEVTGPDGVVHTLDGNFDWLLAIVDSASVHWQNVRQVVLDAGIYPFFVDQGAAGIFLDVIPSSDGAEVLAGDGYKITALDGPAWALLGLGAPQVVDGVGDLNGSIGADTGIYPTWREELETAVDNADFDITPYHSLNYVLIGSPALNEILNVMSLNSVGYLESHSLRASAYVGYGWMRIGHNDSMATWAHESGHNLGLLDQYQYKESLEQPGQFVNGWSMMAYHFYESHVSAWEKHGHIADFWQGSGWLPGNAILSATLPGPSGAVTHSTFILAPQYDPLPTYPGYTDPVGYAVQVQLSGGHALLIEGRQDQPDGNPRRYDQRLDEIDEDAGNGGVVIYDVRYSPVGAEAPNVYRRQLILLSPYDDALDAGDPAYDDPALGVAVGVLEEIGTGSNRAYRVAVDLGRANPPAGTRFDAHITPWDNSWQSPDIWVDSPMNGYGPPYDTTVLTPDGDPDGAGDIIAVGEENHLKARIRNTGPEDIPAADVVFWVATPAGIGDRGDWQRLENMVDGPVGPIPAGGSIIAEAIWIPSGEGHTCVKVEIQPIQDEVSFANNLAQENFTIFEIVGSSPYKPLSFRFDVFNSAEKRRQYALRAKRGIPNVRVELNHAYPVVEAGGKVSVEGRIVLNEDVPPSYKYDTDVSIAAYYPWHDSEIEIGGISLHLQPRTKSQIEVSYKRVKGEVVATGNVSGGPQPRSVTLSIHSAGAPVTRRYGTTKTDKEGSFVLRVPVKSKEPLDVYAYAASIGSAASVRSPTVRLK